jgi:hypothetical protein
MYLVAIGSGRANKFLLQFTSSKLFDMRCTELMLWLFCLAIAARRISRAKERDEQ